MLMHGDAIPTRSIFITNEPNTFNIFNDYIFGFIYRISMIINPIVAFNLIEDVNRVIDRKKQSKNA